MSAFFFLQKPAETVYHHLLVLHHAVRVTIERDGGIFVPQNFGKRPDVYSALKRTSGKSVPQSMKTAMRDVELFLK